MDGMDEMDGLDGWMDGWMDVWVYGCMDVWMMDVHTSFPSLPCQAAKTPRYFCSRPAQVRKH